jgi:TRAP-type C4-dicarboxylate transport system substrate-binding protein
MKKKIWLALLIAMLVGLFLNGWTNSALAAPKKITLGFGHIWPAAHFTQAVQFTHYFKMVEKATKGKYTLDIKYYPVGTLLGGAELYDGVIKGIAESGTSSLVYTPGRFPVMITLYQPGAAPPESAAAAARTVMDFYRKWNPKEFSDTKVLYFYATGPAWLHTKRPIRHLDDIKGLKVRATADNVEVFKLLGAEPVSMVMGEVYVAAKKGVVDSLISPLETLEAWKHAELFDYSTFVPYFYSSFFWVCVNWDKWKALPKDLQDAFDSVAEDAAKQAGAIWDYYQVKAMNFAKKKPGGHEFIRIPEGEWGRVKELTKPIRERYVKMLDGKGLPGEAIMESAGEIMDKYNKQKYEPWKP